MKIKELNQTELVIFSLIEINYSKKIASKAIKLIRKKNKDVNHD